MCNAYNEPLEQYRGGRGSISIINVCKCKSIPTIPWLNINYYPMKQLSHASGMHPSPPSEVSIISCSPIPPTCSRAQWLVEINHPQPAPIPGIHFPYTAGTQPLNHTYEFEYLHFYAKLRALHHSSNIYGRHPSTCPSCMVYIQGKE